MSEIRKENSIKVDIAEHFNQEGIWKVDGDDYYCYRREEEEFDRILGKESCKERLLEIGCGRGRFALRYAGEFATILTIDLSWKMLKALKSEKEIRGVKNLYLFQSDAENLNFKDNSFDVVLAPQVIGHCPHPEAMLKEMSRVLKPGGRGIFSTANYISLPGLKQLNSISSAFLKKGSLLKNIKEYLRDGRVFWLKHERFARDSILSLRKFTRRAGLKIESISGSGIFPTFLSKRMKLIENKSYVFPVKYFCRTIILSFVKS